MNDSSTPSVWLRLMESPDDLRSQLEHELVGPNLVEVVGELETILASNEDPPPLSTELQAKIVRSGLQGLSESEFRELMQHPQQLLDAQKAVLLEASDYWDCILSPSRSVAESAPVRVVAPVPLVPAWPGWALAGWLTAAAAVLFAIYAPGMRVQNLERQLAKQMAINERQRRELEVQQALIPPPTHPTDLPEMHDVVFQDPLDLPEHDPDDLPTT